MSCKFFLFGKLSHFKRHEYIIHGAVAAIEIDRDVDTYCLTSRNEGDGCKRVHLSFARLILRIGH